MSNTITSIPPTGSSYREIKSQGILGLLRLLVLLQYGALSYLFLVRPLTREIDQGNSIDKAWDWSTLGWFTLVCLMAALGVWRMRAALKRVPNRLATEQWVAGAAGLSLPSIYCYISLVDKAQRISALPNTQGISDSLYFSLIAALLLFGFYMPFILLTCWVKYRYRDDEF